MSDLNEILNDIKEDNVHSDVTVNDEDKVLLKDISEEDINEVRKLSDLNDIYDEVTDSDRIEKNIVLEAFAAMNIIKEVDKAKLTEDPSYINKDILTEFVNKTNKIYTLIEITEHLESLQLVKNQAEESVRLLEGLLRMVEDIHNEINIHPIVIQNGVSYNLITDPLTKLIDIDDHEINYENFRDKLSLSIKNVFYGTLSFINNKLNIVNINEEITPLDLIRVIHHIQEYVENFIDYINNLLNLTETNSAKISYILEKLLQYKEVVKQYDNIYYIYKDLTSTKSQLNYVLEYYRLIYKN